MLEGIDNKVAAEAYAVSVALQGRMGREQMNNIARMEKKYGDWIPGFERHFHDGFLLYTSFHNMAILIRNSLLIKPLLCFLAGRAFGIFNK